MLIVCFVVSMLGGAIANLSFDLFGLNGFNILMCILSKIFLMPVFVSLFVLISVAAKEKAWLSVCGSLGGGMLLFVMVPMITPLSSTPMNLLLTVAGSAMFGIGLGFASCTVLERAALV